MITAAGRTMNVTIRCEPFLRLVKNRRNPRRRPCFSGGGSGLAVPAATGVRNGWPNGIFGLAGCVLRPSVSCGFLENGSWGASTSRSSAGFDGMPRGRASVRGATRTLAGSPAAAPPPDSLPSMSICNAQAIPPKIKLPDDIQPVPHAGGCICEITWRALFPPACASRPLDAWPIPRLMPKFRFDPTDAPCPQFPGGGLRGDRNDRGEPSRREFVVAAANSCCLFTDFQK